MSGAPFPTRPAGLKDLDRLGELYLAFGRASAAADPGFSLAIDAGRAWREHIVEGLKAERTRVVVTEDDGRHIVSFLVARVAPSPIGAAVPYTGLIEGAFVEEGRRREGRLKAMTADAMRWFAYKRVPSVDLIADSRDQAAKAAWRALGFSEVQAVFRAPVPPAD